jgi:ribonuclease T1
MRSMSTRRPAALISAALLAFCAVAAIAARDVAARDDSPAGVVAVAALPAEARATLARIRAGGPFPYQRDGVVFGNRERILTPRPRGYYHEYTVPTPGVRSRGAQRIVCGGDSSTLAECYYSDDHYQSFRRIRP